MSANTHPCRLLVGLLLLLPLWATSPTLDLKTIMQDPAWIGEIPQDLALDAKGTTAFFRVRQEAPKPQRLMALDLASGRVTPISDAQMADALARNPITRGEWQVAALSGDLYARRNLGSWQPVVTREERLRPVAFKEDGVFVYRADNQLFRYDLNKGTDRQITAVRFRDEPTPKEGWHQQEERALIQEVAQGYEGEEHRKEQQARLRRALGQPEPVYLGAKWELGDSIFDQFSIDISADNRHLAVVLAPSDQPTPPKYAEFINRDGAVVLKNGYARTGHTTPTWKLVFYNHETQKLTNFDVSSLPEIKHNRHAAIQNEKTEAGAEKISDEHDAPRSVYMEAAGFSGDGHTYLVTVFSRDWKDRWLLLIDAGTGEHELVMHHHNPAWVQNFMTNVPTAPWFGGSAQWHPDRKKVVFLSDHEGYQHFYQYDPGTKAVTALTKGTWEVYSPTAGPEGKYWYFHANREHPGERHFYRMPLAGGDIEQLTQGEGRHTVALSADGKAMVSLFERATIPAVIQHKKKKKWKTLYDGRSEAFKSIKWQQPEFITYTNRDGKPVHARLFTPKQSNGAGVIFVHGAGYLQNAHKGWSGYFRENMFHNLLARAGYTVLDPDFTASSGYGEDWRTGIYRHMGGRDLNDVVDGAAFLAKDKGVDAQKIGVYGGSYGGFISLMAMFTTPDIFQAGAALRPVTDWSYYNHWYTSRILNTPEVDPEAYRRSSPIYHAEGLKGALLICHGMVDNNVPYQDSVRLAQRLIELKKHNWELSSYPVEAHAFHTSGGWYDEYRRIWELFERTLR
ncbi:S9 family peptidase [Acanthopleuribacter pedis]|uniref:S9 family peptidase n=1 Tax=Acanthopleuribacter pedis TaxID=442870 RepID=A0A8J7QCH2_9BACT|nr:prolyl oligopeptidase family serine peptidase [Acanthopleuribacter pedis]MBO1321229.1 S9 family peptidase [Acanthopleuribacter pedis]